MSNEDGRKVLHSTVDKLINTGIGSTIDTHTLLKELRNCGARIVQIDGQRYTHVSLEDLIAAIQYSTNVKED